MDATPPGRSDSLEQEGVEVRTCTFYNRTGRKIGTADVPDGHRFVFVGETFYVRQPREYDDSFVESDRPIQLVLN